MTVELQSLPPSPDPLASDALARAGNALIIARCLVMEDGIALAAAVERAARRLRADPELMRQAIAEAGRAMVQRGRRITPAEVGELLLTAIEWLRAEGVRAGSVPPLDGAEEQPAAIAA